ncbi:hypothetical protein AAF712_011575 [Marasmius tenuissimus]|uniref:Uncharacterized protein n=1 Tax=Marasmius tenuissimus TaxID=585030 RepID=A0ABR2ZKS9_9AGAR
MSIFLALSSSIAKYIVGHSRQNGKKAVQEVLRLQESLVLFKEKCRELEKAILNVEDHNWELNMKQIPEVKKNIVNMEKRLCQKELLLGVEESQEVQHLLSSPYLHERMTTLALKMRLVSQLPARKF